MKGRFASLVLAFTGILLISSTCVAQGACPANAPMAGNHCYFVAANGADSNNGTSESTPWLHAPGMPNCTANCAALSAGNGGIGIILRGGDTWHFGNSSASPYTGGAWDLYNWFSNAYGSNIANCVYEGTQTGCLYVGVDANWYSGSSWARPVLTGDNPTVPGSGNFASSCAYQIAGSDFGSNNLVVMPGWTIVDSLELTGLCASNASTSSGQYYFGGWAAGGSTPPVSMLENVYMHGWSATSTAGTASSSHPVTLLGGGGGVNQVFDHIVIDGSDSNPEVGAWGTFPNFAHMRDSIVRYTDQGVGQGCHDIHDNIFEFFTTTILDGHTNAFECNADASGSTPNVFYNNVFRHFQPSFGNGELVWFCPNTTPEYWFNNLMYDTVTPGHGQSWNVAGTPIYGGCPNTGGQYMFNNTLVDQTSAPCYLGSWNNTGGQYIQSYNNHLINTPWDGSGGQSGHCAGGPSSSGNVSMTDAQATSQGYTTGGAGTVTSNTCTNDSTSACSPPASSSATAGTGNNLQAYCKTLASYTSEPAISFDAANACKNGTTDGCSYNSTTHTMNCPVKGVISRPATTAWDSGAYQYYGLGAPTNLKGTP